MIRHEHFTRARLSMICVRLCMPRNELCLHWISITFRHLSLNCFSITCLNWKLDLICNYNCAIIWIKIEKCMYGGINGRVNGGLWDEKARVQTKRDRQRPIHWVREIEWKGAKRDKVSRLTSHYLAAICGALFVFFLLLLIQNDWLRSFFKLLPTVVQCTLRCFS